MAVFIDLLPCLFITKLSYTQLFKCVTLVNISGLMWAPNKLLISQEKNIHNDDQSIQICMNCKHIFFFSFNLALIGTNSKNQNLACCYAKPRALP